MEKNFYPAMHGSGTGTLNSNGIFSPQFDLPLFSGFGVDAQRNGFITSSVASPDVADNVLQQLVSMPSQQLDDPTLESKKQKLNNHHLRTALFTVLAEIKDRTALSVRNNIENDSQDPQIARLNNMLIAEGVAEPDKAEMVAAGVSASRGGAPAGTSDLNSPTEHAEYHSKLARVREFYQNECRDYDKHRTEFMNHVINVLREQGNIRPITTKEIDRMVAVVDKKFCIIQMHVKQSACEQVMHLRSRFLDARRKRRNFSKNATEILNEYFRSHVSNPYPSEQAKEELARQCNITVSQISNWFGNKRIRFKKNISKS